MIDTSLPPYRIEKCIPEKREPGIMVFNVRPGGSADNKVGVGWLLGLDQQGNLPLNLKFENPVQDVRSLPNGNLLFSLTGAGLIMETTVNGEIIRQWHIAGKWKDQTPPAGSIEIAVELTHHTINHFPNGNLLLLTAERRQYDDWPENDTEEGAPRSTRNIIGDVILEVLPNGKILNQWALLDILDPYRLSYGSCGGYWNSRGFTDSNDWCHTNAVTYNSKDDSIIASLRTQDCLIKFDRQSGELKWILGNPGNWKSPWAKKLLTPVGEVEWQYHQHDCSVTPDGTILCFDNGNNRALPFETKMTDEQSYSRAVEFDIDESAMTVRQVWAYGKAPDERLYACYQGGAFRLPKTGNTFITYGGVCTRDGKPAGEPNHSFAQSRLVEVTPTNEVVFDLWIDDSASDNPMPLSSFRSEHIAES